MKKNEKQGVEQPGQTCYQTEEDNPIVLSIKEKRNLYLNEMKRCEDIFTGCKEMVANCNLKGKKKKEAQQFLRKLKKHLKMIRLADNNVQMAINDLLDLRSQNEGFMKIHIENNNQSDCTQKNTSFDSISIIDFPKKHTGPKVLRFNNEVSIIYQQHVYQLVYSLLLLHEKISSFVFHQADIVWIVESDSRRKKMTLNEFLTKISPQRLSRNDCLECIEKVLKKKE